MLMQNDLFTKMENKLDLIMHGTDKLLISLVSKSGGQVIKHKLDFLL